MPARDDAPTLQGTPEAGLATAPALGDEAGGETIADKTAGDSTADQTADAQTADDQTAYARALRAELDRRIAALAAAPDDTFGAIGQWDGVLIAFAFVLLPALIVWLNR